MRWGGLGGSGGSAFPGTKRVSIGIVGTGMGSTSNGLSLAESLLEEDEVLLRIQIRRDALQTMISNDLCDGRRP